jgi:hypothetical protein
MVGESIFFAAFVGAVITEVGLCKGAPHGASRHLATTLLRGACAGYVALRVLGLERTDFAFTAGLTFDLVIAGLRKLGERTAHREVARDTK